MSVTAGEIRAPSAFLLLAETRALYELGAYFAARPLLDLAPQGDGHPVLVIPGMGATDVSTRPLRAYLRGLGYYAHRWKQGRNFGPREGIVDALLARIRELRAQTGRRVSLVGWSLGGLFARELAKRLPEDVRIVISLGSPFAGPREASNPHRLYQALNAGGRAPNPPDMRLVQPPPQPCTSIYTRTDGVVAWQCCVQAESRFAENIEVPGSHMGLGHNPLVLYAVADRLAQAEGQWLPFHRGGLRRWLYPRPARA